MKANWNKIRINSIYLLAFLVVSAKYIGLLTGGWFSLVLFIIDIVLLGTLIITSLLHLILILNKRQLIFKSFLPLILAMLCIFVVLISPVERIIERTKSEVVLLGFCEHTVSSASIKLREDFTYEYNTGAFLDDIVYKGAYYQNNDTIVLSLNENKLQTFSDTLVLDGNLLKEIGDSTRHRHSFILEINMLK